MVLTLTTAYDVQLELSAFVKKVRKKKGYSVKDFSKMTGVPNSTIRKFEKTGEISLRQFLTIYSELGQLKDLQQLTKIAAVPRTLDEVIKYQT